VTSEERARRERALEDARALVQTWSPDELLVLDILEARFVRGLEDPTPPVGGQEFGLEFVAGAGCAAAILYLCARAQGVPGPSARSVSFELKLLVDVTQGRASRGQRPERGGLIERGLAAALAERWDTMERALMACREAGVPEPDLPAVTDAPALWKHVVGTLHAREDWARLEELVSAALEERADERLRTWRDLLRLVR
jgi:hypothetical protein